MQTDYIQLGRLDSKSSVMKYGLLTLVTVASANNSKSQIHHLPIDFQYSNVHLINEIHPNFIRLSLTELMALLKGIWGFRCGRHSALGKILI